MRKALNDNPAFQLVVIGLAGVIFAFLLYTTVLSGDDAPVGPGTATEVAGDSAAAPEPVVTDEVVPAEPAPTLDPTPAPAVGSEGLLPTKGLPADVLVAYAKNKAITLIVFNPKARPSDPKVEASTERLRARDDVAVFNIKVKEIADYARITGGVAVNRTPALVVVRPRDRTDDVPTATVSYGFRSAKSVEGAVEDALYGGESRSTAPE